MISNTKGYLCKNCIHKGTTRNGSSACSLHKHYINEDTDFCSWHASNNDSFICPICKQNINIKDIIVFIDKNKNSILLCESCLQYMGTCATCMNNNNCGFRADKTEPQTIPKIVQQGMMRVQTQIKNPKLVIKHCQKCVCSDGANPAIKDITCFKDENGTLCSNWQILPTLLQ